MAWVREGESPDNIKVSFIVNAKEYPELSNFIWSLPYRATSKTLRDILSAAVKQALQQSGVGTDQNGDVQRLNVAVQSQAQAPQTQVTQQGDPIVAPQSPPQKTASTSEVTTAAAGIIQNFDKMFPS